MTKKREYSLCIDCKHQKGTWVSDREVDTWCTIKKGIDRGSGIIRSMVEANSYIIIDENDEGYQKNDIVDVVFFDSLLW